MGFFQKLLRIEPGITVGQWAYDRITNNWSLIVSAFVGLGGMSYVAAITEWVQAWGPVGIGAVGLTSAMSVWVGIAWAQSLRANARLRRAQERAIDKWKDDVDQINPLDDTFHKKRIKLHDLIHPVTKTIKGKKFTDCELIGPANIVIVGGGSFVGVTFGDCDIVVLKPNAQWPLGNAVRFENIQMYNGAIWNCTVLIPQGIVDMFVDMGAKFVTLTGRPEIDNLKPPTSEAKTPP